MSTSLSTAIPVDDGIVLCLRKCDDVIFPFRLQQTGAYHLTSCCIVATRCLIDGWAISHPCSLALVIILIKFVQAVWLVSHGTLQESAGCIILLLWVECGRRWVDSWQASLSLDLDWTLNRQLLVVPVVARLLFVFLLNRDGCSFHVDLYFCFSDTVCCLCPCANNQAPFSVSDMPCFTCFMFLFCPLPWNHLKQQW